MRTGNWIARRFRNRSNLNTGNYEAPQGDLEEALARIWSQVLGMERIGRRDNFFELGGDSILSLRVAGRAREAGITLVLKQLLEHPQLSELAASIAHGGLGNSGADVAFDIDGGPQPTAGAIAGADASVVLVAAGPPEHGVPPQRRTAGAGEPAGAGTELDVCRIGGSPRVTAHGLPVQRRRINGASDHGGRVSSS